TPSLALCTCSRQTIRLAFIGRTRVFPIPQFCRVFHPEAANSSKNGIHARFHALRQVAFWCHQSPSATTLIIDCPVRLTSHWAISWSLSESGSRRFVRDVHRHPSEKSMTKCGSRRLET